LKGFDDLLPRGYQAPSIQKPQIPVKPQIQEKPQISAKPQIPVNTPQTDTPQTEARRIIDAFTDSQARITNQINRLQSAVADAKQWKRIQTELEEIEREWKKLQS
jgi:hypothetical protein